MNRSTAMIMGGALVVAIIVAMLVQMKMSPKQKADKAQAETTEVLVANKKLLTGEVLKAENVHWEQVPDSLVFKGMIKRKDQEDENKLEVYDKPLRRVIESGEPVTTQALVTNAEGGNNFLSASIEPGMRAIAVPVKPEAMAGGFIAPGDYVDVIMTYQVNLRGGDEEKTTASAIIQKFASETILSNIHVLAVDQNAKENGHEAKIGKTVTLEVTKGDAQVLVMAVSMGQISLSLRRLGEKDTVADRDVPLTTDVSTSRVMQKVRASVEQSKTSSSTVRMYSGANVSNVPVRLGVERK